MHAGRSGTYAVCYAQNTKLDRQSSHSLFFFFFCDPCLLSYGACGASCWTVRTGCSYVCAVGFVGRSLVRMECGV